MFNLPAAAPADPRTCQKQHVASRSMCRPASFPIGCFTNPNAKCVNAKWHCPNGLRHSRYKDGAFILMLTKLQWRLCQTISPGFYYIHKFLICHLQHKKSPKLCWATSYIQSINWAADRHRWNLRSTDLKCCKMGGICKCEMRVCPLMSHIRIFFHCLGLSAAAFPSIPISRRFCCGIHRRGLMKREGFSDYSQSEIWHVWANNRDNTI